MGDEVEVLFAGQGFRGARYGSVATITTHLLDFDRYMVMYSELVKCCGGPPLQEIMAASFSTPFLYKK
jgi:hypothetical protein